MRGRLAALCAGFLARMHLKCTATKPRCTFESSLQPGMSMVDVLGLKRKEPKRCK